MGELEYTRRDFLKTVGLGTVALALPEALTPVGYGRLLLARERGDDALSLSKGGG